MGPGFAVGPALDGAAARVFLAEGGGDGADLGVDARGEDDALCAALGDGRGRVGYVEAVAGSGVVGEGGVLVLADREGLAGEEGLVCLEVDGLGEAGRLLGVFRGGSYGNRGREGNLPHVSRDGIASLDLNQVSGNDVCRGHNNRLPRAHDGAGGGTKGAKRVHGLLGRVLLEEADDDVEQDDKGDDAALDPGLEAEGDGHGEDEDLGGVNRVVLLCSLVCVLFLALRFSWNPRASPFSSHFLSPSAP